MFGPWRKLALATSLCLPVALADAAPVECPQYDACGSVLDSSRTQRDVWYRSYKRTDITADLDPLLDATNSYDTEYALDPTVIPHAVPTLDSPTFLPPVPALDTLEPSQAEFDDSCPYGDPNWQPFESIETPADSHDFESEPTNLYDDDVHASDLPATELSDTMPNDGEAKSHGTGSARNAIDQQVAMLTGTIEPMDMDEIGQVDSPIGDERFNAEIQSEPALPRENSVILQFDDAAGADEASSEQPGLETENYDESAGQFHMFYPGFDWSAYLPDQVL